MKITFGICTYNRKHILERTAASLHRIKGIHKINIRIYDDASTEYDLSYLQQLFPDAKSIKRNEKNMRADWTISSMYKDFLTTDDEVLFNADSDLIFDESIVEKIQELLPQTDGFLNLFNGCAHKKIADVNDLFCVKEDVGSAGSCITRELVQLIADNITHIKKNFDWQYCKLLNKKHIRIMCTHTSYCQHIGFLGQNAIGHIFDYGSDFTISSLEDAQALENTLEEYVRFIDARQYLLQREAGLAFFREHSFFTRIIAKIIKIRTQAIANKKIEALKQDP